MKHILSLAVLILLTSCASTSETYSSDGSKAHTINCSGTARNWGMCYETAGNICGANGYEVLSKDENPSSAINVSDGSLAAAFMSSKYQRVLTITCREVHPAKTATPSVAITDAE